MATVGFGGSRGGALEHSASELGLACRVGNLAKMGKPDSWIALQVRTDGFRAGQVDFPGEAPGVPWEGAGKRGTSGNTSPKRVKKLRDAVRASHAATTERAWNSWSQSFGKPSDEDSSAQPLVQRNWP